MLVNLFDEYDRRVARDSISAYFCETSSICVVVVVVFRLLTEMLSDSCLAEETELAELDVEFEAWLSLLDSA